MAMIKTNTPLVELSGKRGGNVYYQCRCSYQVRNDNRRTSSEASAGQKKRQRAFRECMNFLREFHTDHMVYCWQHYAYQHPRRNRKGEIYYLDWHHMFMAYNIPRAYNGLGIWYVPPGYPWEPPE
jgi:hypothetical protein